MASQKLFKTIVTAIFAGFCVTAFYLALASRFPGFGANADLQVRGCKFIPQTAARKNATAERLQKYELEVELMQTSTQPLAAVLYSEDRAINLFALEDRAANSGKPYLMLAHANAKEGHLKAGAIVDTENFNPNARTSCPVKVVFY